MLPVGLSVAEELRSLPAKMPAASVAVGVALETRQLMVVPVVPVVLTEPHWVPDALRRTVASAEEEEAALKDSVSDRERY